MKPQFVDNPIQVGNELEALGLCEEGLLRVVEAIRLARNNCTPNDVPAARGLRGWLDGTRTARDYYCPKGWERNEDEHISSLYHPEKKIKVMVSNTDDATGLNLSDRQPQNRSRKGPATDRAVTSNQQQLNLFEDWMEAANIVRLDLEEPGVQHWFLLVYHEGDAKNGDIVRAELSLPAKCEGGYFTTFHKRIVLIGDSAPGDDGSGIKIAPDGTDGGDYEINVTRKQA
jgi:hypothetical protein